MKKVSRKFRSFLWILVAVSAMHAENPAYAAAQPKDAPAVELKQKMNRFKRLIKDLKETRELYRKKQARKASSEELQKLESRIKIIKKSLYVAASALLAVLAAGSGIAYWMYKKRAELRLEQERLEQERLKREQEKEEQLKRERLGKEKQEKQERLEKGRLEKDRLEKERLEREKKDKERLEQEQKSMVTPFVRGVANFV